MLNDKVWAEKYRPVTVDDIILPSVTKSMIKDAIKNNSVQHLMLYGNAGCGKTTLSRAIAHDLGADLMYLNCSLDSSIDDIRNQVVSFSSSVSLSGGSKIVLLDECLHEDEKVRIGTLTDWKTISLKDLEFDTEYPIVSFNMETLEFENDSGYIISDRSDELYEVLLDNGSTVRCNKNHPFVCISEDGISYERTIKEGLVGHNVICASN